MNDKEQTQPQQILTTSEDETEIDLLELAFVLLNKIWLLILCGVCGAVLAFAATKLLITPQYQASSTLYIFTKTTSITSLTDLQIGTQLTADFQTLALSRPVVDRVIEELQLDTTYENLCATISVTNPSDSRMLRITVTNPDPQLAADISNAMSTSLADRVAEVINTDKPSTVEDAVVPTAASSPSTKRNTMIGGLLGVVLAAGLVLLFFMLDDTINSEDDVERYLQMNTLATIPLESGEKKKKKGGKSPKNKRTRRTRSTAFEGEISPDDEGMSMEERIASGPLGKIADDPKAGTRG